MMIKGTFFWPEQCSRSHFFGWLQHPIKPLQGGIGDRVPRRGVIEAGPPRISGLAGLVSVRGLPAG